MDLDVTLTDFDGYVPLGPTGELRHVADGRCEVTVLLPFEALAVPAGDFVAAITKASLGLDDVTVSFDGDLESAYEYGYGGESFEISELKSVTTSVSGWRELTDAEAHHVASHVEQLATDREHRPPRPAPPHRSQPPLTLKSKVPTSTDPVRPGRYSFTDRRCECPHPLVKPELTSTLISRSILTPLVAPVALGLSSSVQPAKLFESLSFLHVAEQLKLRSISNSNASTTRPPCLPRVVVPPSSSARSLGQVTHRARVTRTHQHTPSVDHRRGFPARTIACHRSRDPPPQLKDDLNSSLWPLGRDRRSHGSAPRSSHPSRPTFTLPTT